MKRSIVAAILITFVAAACVAEVLGERPVASPAYGPPPGYRQGSASASDGHDFLVVWIDSSRSRTYSYTRIYATRVNAAGQVLDPLGIRIPTLTASPTQVNVVYLGNAYFVCWNEGYASTSTTPPLAGIRISTDGQLLDSAPHVFTDHAILRTGGVASNGSRAIIAYNGPSGSLMSVILDRDANIVDGPRTITGTALSPVNPPIAASNGHGFLVLRTLANANHAIATALDANGAVLATTETFTATPGGALGLASDGDSYVATFEGTAQIGAQHFGPNGAVLESSLFAIQQLFPQLYSPRQQVFTALVFAGDSYLLMDGDSTQKTFGLRRLTRTGQPTGGYSPIAQTTTLSYSFWYSTTLAYNGSSAFAGWVAPDPQYQILTGSVIDGATLAASTPSMISRSATRQITPAGASSGTNTAIVWNEDDGVYAARIAIDGQMLDGRGVRISALSPSTSTPAVPSIFFDGANYIIGWVENPTGSYNVISKVARFAPGTGAVLDPNGITITQKGYGGLAFAPAPNGTLAAWAEGGHIVAMILGRDLSHGPVVIADPGEDLGGGNVSAAWNGSEWLLTWVKPVLPLGGGPQCDPVPCYDYFIDAARLSPQLTLLDPISIVVSSTRADYGPPFAASDGDGFLVAWSRQTYDYFSVEGGYAYSTYAQRISRDGSLLGPVNGVRIGAGQARSIVWDGLQYDVASTARRYPPYFASSFMSRTASLNVTHIAAHGTIEGLTPQTVITDLSDPDASLIVTGTGNATVAYTRIGTEPEYGDVERVFVTVPHVIRGRASR